MSVDINSSVDRIKKTATSHTETYVAIHPDDVRAIASHPSLNGNKLATDLDSLVDGALDGPEPCIRVHRDKHLAPLLKAIDGTA